MKLKDGFIPNELNKVVTLGKRIKVANKEKKSKNTKEKSLEIEQQKKIQKHKKYKRQIFQRLKRVEY